MIVDIGKYYLYRHIRLDTNKPFYIGIGTKKDYNTFKSIYARAFEKKSGRNKYWKNIVAKTDYKVEILIESNDYNFIKEKEKEFISFYKKLSNFTLGGEGFSCKHNKSSIQKMLITKELKRRKIEKENTEKILELYNQNYNILYIAKELKINKNFVKKILDKHITIKKSSFYSKTIFYLYDFKNNNIEVFNCNYNYLAKHLNICEPTIRNHINNKKKITECNYLIQLKKIKIEKAFDIYNNRVLNKSKQPKIYKPKKKIIQKDLEGKIVKIWENMQNIIDQFNLKSSTPILRVIKKQRKHYKKFIWERLI